MYLIVFGKGTSPEMLSNLNASLASVGMKVAPSYASLSNVIECIGQRETDERLVRSTYYQTRKSTWFGQSSEVAELIAPSPIELTAHEMHDINRLEAMLAASSIIGFQQGVYDVTQVSTTY